VWRFIIQTPDKDVQIIAIDARDIDHAFSIFARHYWRRSMASPIGVWTGGRLVGRVVAGTDPDGHDRPYLLKGTPP
jgi:hypothetical protein